MSTVWDGLRPSGMVTARIPHSGAMWDFVTVPLRAASQAVSRS